MRSARHALLLSLPLLGTLGLGACAAPTPEPDRAVIAHLQTRDRRLTLYHTPDGTRFAVRDHDGRLVAADLTLDNLRAGHPALFDLYQSALARPIDASLTLPERPDRPDRRPF